MAFFPWPKLVDLVIIRPPQYRPMPPPPRTEIILLSLIALPKPTPPSIEELQTVFASFFGDAAIVEVESDIRLHIALGQEEISLVISSTSIDSDVWQPACEKAWYWPEAAFCMERHQSHLVLIVEEDTKSSAMAKSMLLTRLTSLIGEYCGYSAVYWEPSAMVHSNDAVSESSKEMSEHQLPLRLWIRFQLVENEDGTRSLFTEGLQALGFLELEVRASRKKAEYINGWAFNVAHYVLKKGELVGDGETVGVNPSEWIRVYHLPSAIEAERTVLFLDLDLDEELAADAQKKP